MSLKYDKPLLDLLSSFVWWLSLCSAVG